MELLYVVIEITNHKMYKYIKAPYLVICYCLKLRIIFTLDMLKRLRCIEKHVLEEFNVTVINLKITIACVLH